MSKLHYVRHVVTAVALGVVALGASTWQQTVVAQQPPAQRPFLCKLGLPLSPSGPATPQGLLSELVEQLQPGVFGVRLSWQPVANAICTGIDVRMPDAAEELGILTEVPGTSTQVDLSFGQLTRPGVYCFRAVAANEAGRSPYSAETCLEIPGAQLVYSAGWNLLAGPNGPGTALTSASEPLYTYQTGDLAYEVIPAGTRLRAGYGYWAYFATPTTERFPALVLVPLTRELAPGQFVMVGNPSAVQQASVTGADAIYVYDPVTGVYSQTAVLQPGQGAWAFSANGGTLTIGPVTP